MTRFLFTGSREWKKGFVVTDLLSGFIVVQDKITIINGKAPGLDKKVSDTARQLGWPEELIEEYPKEDFESPRARNQHMVDLGADICFAFALDWKSGTGMCARMARRAGIPVIDFGVDTA